MAGFVASLPPRRKNRPQNPRRGASCVAGGGASVGAAAVAVVGRTPAVAIGAGTAATGTGAGLAGSDEDAKIVVGGVAMWL